MISIEEYRSIVSELLDELPEEFFREPRTERARQFLQSFTYASRRKKGHDFL